MSAERDAAPGTQPAPLAGRVFWLTIIVLFAATLLLIGLAAYRIGRSTESPAAQPAAPGLLVDEAAAIDGVRTAAPLPRVIDLPAGVIRRAAEAAARDAQRTADAELELAMRRLFDPVYIAIPRYTDYHYSVLGEYTELASAALGERLAPGIEEQLLAGFDERLSALLQATDERYRQEFRRSFLERVDDAIPDTDRHLPLAGASELAIDATLRRAQLSLPLASVAASGAAALSIKQVLGVAAAAAAAKTTGKLAGKALLKSGGGAAAGATAGAVLGPAGAVAGGLAGGIVTWIGIDWLVIRADEYLHREDFEAHLRDMVADEEQALLRSIESALAARSRRLGGLSLREAREAVSEQRRDQHRQGGGKPDRPDQ